MPLVRSRPRRAPEHDLTTAVTHLSTLERQVLERRLGLVDGVPQSRARIAEELQLQPGFVAEIEARGREHVRQLTRPGAGHFMAARPS